MQASCMPVTALSGSRCNLANLSWAAGNQPHSPDVLDMLLGPCCCPSAAAHGGQTAGLVAAVIAA